MLVHVEVVRLINNMDELSKDRRRAVRRKRNLIAKDLRMNKLYSPKTIEPKRVRHKISVREIDDYLEEDEMRKEA